MPETPEPLKPTEPGGEMEHQDPSHADDLEKAQSTGQSAGQEERSYDPTDVEATRARQQGGGVGQKDLDAQRDATGADSTGRYGQMKPEGGREGGSDVEGGETRKGGVEQP